MTKLKDIADRLGVAPSTVSKGLNGAEDISEDLRQLIIDTAVEMGYVTKRMRKEKHRKLAIIIQGAEFEKKSDSGYAYVMGFKQLAQKSHWAVDAVAMTPELQAERKYDSYMLRNGYSGAFLIGFSQNDPWISQLSGCKTPAVVLDLSVFGSKVTALQTDYAQLFYTLMEHVHSLGHTQIAYLCGPVNNSYESRKSAFTFSCEQFDIATEQCAIAADCDTLESVQKVITNLIPKGITVFICETDDIAKLVYTASSKLNYRIPEDISVIGLGNTSICTSLSPMLTSISSDDLLVGKSAYNTMMGLIEHLPLQQVSLKSSLTVRKSTEAKKNA